MKTHQDQRESTSPPIDVAPQWNRTTPRHRRVAEILFWGVSFSLALGLRAAEIVPLYAFTNHFNPSSLYLARDGNFYGIVAGATGDSSVFRLTLDGAYSELASLSAADGVTPFNDGPMAQDSQGNLLGASYGGGNSAYGTVYQVTPHGELTHLVSFNGTNGCNPTGGLLADTSGNYYGTTVFGGAGTRGHQPLREAGTVFKVDSSGALTTLVNFNRTNGAAPRSSLIWGAGPSLYGTTSGGGEFNRGTVFRLSSGGVLTTLASFNADVGAGPQGSLVQSPDGSIYGTTAFGGPADLGTVFRLTTNGVLSILASFNGTNGSYPYSGLTLGSDGHLYGTTDLGGIGYNGSQDSGFGTVFRVSTQGRLTTVGYFKGTNGTRSITALAQGPDGYIYGTVWLGGDFNNGSIFRVRNRTQVGLAMQPDGALELEWNGLPGFRYQLQYQSASTSPNWVNLGNPHFVTETPVRLTDPHGPDSGRLYRVLESSEPD